MYISRISIERELARQGLNQAKLAKLSGVSPQSISALINKERCKPETAGRIATALGIDVAEITKEERA